MHIFSVTVNHETEPSIIASYPECLEYIARLTDARGIVTDNVGSSRGTTELAHLGQCTLERRRRLISGALPCEHIAARSAFTGKPMAFVIKLVDVDVPKGFEPQILQPIIGVRLKDTSSAAIPNRTLETTRGRRGKVLI